MSRSLVYRVMLTAIRTRPPTAIPATRGTITRWPTLITSRTTSATFAPTAITPRPGPRPTSTMPIPISRSPAPISSVPCISCHSAGYQNTPTDCYACHQADFDGVTDPNHVSNNFSHTCTECHTTAAWSPATFNHNLTGFPLTGAHVSLACLACHANGYENTPSDCVACHQADYNNYDRSQSPGDGLPDRLPDLSLDLRLGAIDLEPRLPAFPHLLGTASGRMVDLRRLPSEPQRFRCLRVHLLPRAQPARYRPSPYRRPRLSVQQRRLL